jgi:hypothetical protein
LVVGLEYDRLAALTYALVNDVIADAHSYEFRIVIDGVIGHKRAPEDCVAGSLMRGDPLELAPCSEVPKPVRELWFGFTERMRDKDMLG